MKTKHLEPFVPRQTKMRATHGRARGVCSFHPDDYEVLTGAADALGVSIPVLIMTLVEYSERKGVAN